MTNTNKSEVFDPTVAQTLSAARQTQLLLNSTSLPPRKIAIVGSGGAGKSTMANTMVSIAEMKGLHLDLFDCDPANRSLHALFPIPDHRVLADPSQEVTEVFLEQQVHADGIGTSLIDFGANTESAALYWFQERGQEAELDWRFLVVMSKVDSIYTASRLIDNTKAPVLLVLNGYGGRTVEEIARSTDFAALREKCAGHIVLPGRNSTVQAAHIARKSLFQMAREGSAFDRVGALKYLRQVEEAFSEFPEFVPWG